MLKIGQKMWLVRAGEPGYLFDQFQQEQVVAIGWSKIGDLSSLKRLEQIKQALRKNLVITKKEE